jgi:hypothetical protein
MKRVSSALHWCAPAPEKHDDYQMAINDDYGSFLML